jgi:HAD superfamily hydrolase (TIGR01509 family)
MKETLMENSIDVDQYRNVPKLSVREVFFDFEGTLVNFQWQLEPAVEECLTSLSEIGFKRQLYGNHPSYAYIYNHTHSLSAAGKSQIEIENAMALIDKIYDKYDAYALTLWDLYPDTLESLSALRRMGFKMGVISNVGRASLGEAMVRLGLADFIGIVISRDDVSSLKPSPEGLLRAARVLEVLPEECLFVGDSRNDVGAARKAGMLSAYLSGGEDSPKAMSPQPADIEIGSLNSLLAVLKRME